MPQVSLHQPNFVPRDIGTKFGMKKLYLALILIGVSSIVAQIVILRELLLLFYGNELCIGIILANWLFWTSIGSLVGGKISKKINKSIEVLSLTEIILSFLLIITILSARGIKSILLLSPGEILGIIPIWLYSFILLSGICATNGFLFVIGCRAYEKSRPKAGGAESIGKVYILESIGAGAGGLLCSIFLIKYLNTLQIIWLLVLANLISAGLLWRRNKWIIFSSVAIILTLGLSGIVNIVNLETRRWQWKGYNIIASRDSIYGNVIVTKRDSEYNFYENGLLTFSFPDRLSSEETAHLALLQNPDPKKILLIGGGVGGVLEECLKYNSVELIDYVELDPLIIKLAYEFFPKIENSKINIYNIDGRKFLNTTNNYYDVIIVNLPDPNNAQINRFYTFEFFKSAINHLNKDGVLSIGATSSENYISPELGNYLRCIYYTLKIVFPEIKVIPGEYCRFIAGKNDEFLTDDYKILEKRLKADTLYVKSYYLKDRLSPEKLNYIHKQLSLEKPKFINTDFHPVCYYYNITYWSTYFNITFKKIFQFMAKMKLWHFLILLLLVFLIKTKNGNYVLIPIMTSGFSEISFQIVTILAFQVLYGYVYYKLGIIITSFMIGLALGGYWINRILARSPRDREGMLKGNYLLFLKTQIAITVYPLLLPIIFYIFTRFEKLSFLGEHIILPFLPIIAGFIGGYQFPLGNKIYLSEKKEIGYTAGLTYGIDLFGSCIGVLLISAFILPVLGITQTCLVTAIVNLCSLIIILKSRTKI